MKTSFKFIVKPGKKYIKTPLDKTLIDYFNNRERVKGILNWSDDDCEKFIADLYTWDVEYKCKVIKALEK